MMDTFDDARAGHTTTIMRNGRAVAAVVPVEVAAAYAADGFQRQVLARSIGRTVAGATEQIAAIMDALRLAALRVFVPAGEDFGEALRDPGLEAVVKLVEGETLTPEELTAAARVLEQYRGLPVGALNPDDVARLGLSSAGVGGHRVEAMSRLDALSAIAATEGDGAVLTGRLGGQHDQS